MKTFFAVPVLLLLAFAPRSVRATWSPGGLPVCVQPNDQSGAAMVSDGFGGTILAWSDSRGASADIYAQRINGVGVPQWAANGVAVCTAANAQARPAIVADGTGGAIIVWVDSRSGDAIYAQRVDASGATQWTTDGVLLCPAAADLYVNPAIVEDGAGGAVVAWDDRRSGTNYDVYVQRVDASGSPQWTASGVQLTTNSNDQRGVQIVSNGAGGAIVAWEHKVSLAVNDVYARAVSASGVAQWAANGVAICTSPKDQTVLTIAPDGAGGAIMAWQDERNSVTVGYDVYAQRVNPSGTVLWTANGVKLCTDPEDQFGPVIAPDGAGGAVIAWDDWRPGPSSDIYAQKIDASGLLQWPLAGVPLSTAPDDQSYPSTTGDGAGGAIVAWHDWRGGATTDVYAQHVGSDGSVSWAVDGAAVSTAVENQASTRIVSDGAGGAFVGWHDYRSHLSYDVYVTRLGANGEIPSNVHDTPSASTAVISPNFPNPFSSETAFDLDLRHAGVAQIDVFDVAGRRVREIDAGRAAAGSTRVTFDGLDDSGRPLPSGVYFYRVTVAGKTFTRKMVIAR